MRIAVRHTSRYLYSDAVKYGLQRLRLEPKHTSGQTVLAWEMGLEGARKEVEYDDQHNNHTVLVTMDEGASELAITCAGLVETADNSGVIGHQSGFLPLWFFLRQTSLTRPGTEIRQFAAELRGEGRDELDLLHALSNRVAERVRYEKGRTDATTTAEEALSAGHGVCQDQAHVFLSAARLLGFPARYVGGYLMMKDRVEQEAGHAWTEAHVNGLGWVGFDISNGISPDPHYIRVATGLDYRDAAPITGISFGPGESRLEVSLAVEHQPAQQ